MPHDKSQWCHLHCAVPDLTETHTDRFEALVCTTKTQDCKEVIDILLEELKNTFLWHDTIDDFDSGAIQKLEGIWETAVKTNVLVTISGKGKDEKLDIKDLNFVIFTLFYIIMLKVTEILLLCLFQSSPKANFNK